MQAFLWIKFPKSPYLVPGLQQLVPWTARTIHISRDIYMREERKRSRALPAHARDTSKNSESARVVGTA